ncbi:MAG: aminotransferase class V-fold PLP-dependent enzyme [Neisseriaceae bacterium]|nr:MAG: aminotransferase class V-fold PLP-dependent enzyme [Neisseriaceae bacterium]
MLSSLKTVDPDELLEYSVVYTDRAVNHMSKKFQITMRDLSCLFKEFYHANHVAIIPGSGTSGMEAVARQLAQGQKCMTLRNGLFNFRWTEIFNMAKIPSEEIVLTAKPTESGINPYYAPASINEVIESITQHQPDLVFTTHVETSSGIILSDEYIQKVAKATYDNGGLLILDCIASGATWVDMQKLGVDILITAPQKVWSSTPCCGIVLSNDRARLRIQDTQSDSFALDLKKWFEIMQAYENGNHAYHTTMPTDSLMQLRDAMLESKEIGLEKLKEQQAQLGRKVRDLLKKHNIKSVADPSVAAPSIVVSYATSFEIKSGKTFAENGVQISSGVPLKCGESDEFSTFRLGLLGIDKWNNVDKTVELLAKSLEKVFK